NGLWMGQIP
ncbi:ABC-2 transporter family protein, partial [Vibrio parahaemolyticus V-223/04]